MLLAEDFDLVQKVENELQSILVDPACGTEVLNLPKFAQALLVEEGRLPARGGDRLNEARFLIAQDGCGIHIRQFGDDLKGVGAIGPRPVNRKIRGVF